MQQNNGSVPPVSYPLTNVQVAPDGMIVTVVFSPTISFSILLDKNTCHEIAKNILLQEKQQLNMLDMARRIQKEKLA